MKNNNNLRSFVIAGIEKRKEIIDSDFFLNEGVEAIQEIVAILTSALLNGNKLMFCGNGGSAAESQHMAAEYCATLDHNKPRKGYKAIALSTDTSLLTAWSNDFGYEGIFERQVDVLGDKGDVLICYSTSGNSENVLRAAKLAIEKKIHVIGFSGVREGKLDKFSEVSFKSPSPETPIIQEHHTIAGHIICSCVEKNIEGDS